MCECLQYYDERGNPEGRYYCIVCDDMAREALTGKCCEFHVRAERRAIRDALWRELYVDDAWDVLRGDRCILSWFAKGGRFEIEEEGE